MKSLRTIIPEGYEENKKKHGEAAEDYAGKIKCLCKELTDLTGKYDSYTLKSVARELEDIFERIDCDVESRKDQKKREAEYANKSPSVAMHEEENLDEGKKKNKDLIRKFMSHDPETAERIIKFGEKSRREAKAFKSAKAEINRVKKKEKKLDEGKFKEMDIKRQEKEAKKKKLKAKLKRKNTGYDPDPDFNKSANAPYKRIKG